MLSDGLLPTFVEGWCNLIQLEDLLVPGIIIRNCSGDDAEFFRVFFLTSIGKSKSSWK